MIHRFPEDFIFEEPSQFTDPFRYIPHPAVKEAARQVIKHIESDEELASAFSEGKMLGVLVCRQRGTKKESHCYLAAFSGNVGGRGIIDGFVPPVYDLTDPDGEFKRREAEISRLNHQIACLSDSENLSHLSRKLSDIKHKRDTRIAAMKEQMGVSKRKREERRHHCTDETVLAGLTRESQFEKAELRRTRLALDAAVAKAQDEIDRCNENIESLKRQRAAMSESLQNWIFRQYIVHNGAGESSSVAEIFASEGLVPPGGTGECAAPKLLEYAFRNDLEPLAMGEFWYGHSPNTAVRTHGHFYPSCTSKCGPLLGYMLHGITATKISVEIPDPIIIYEDEAIIVVEKPSGMPSVPGLDGRESLLEWLQAQKSSPDSPNDRESVSNEQEKPKHLHSVHRLDMDTSGVMIFAKTHEAAVNLRRQFEEHTVHKTYMARVSASESLAAEGTIKLPLSPDYDERPRQKIDFKQGKPAYTEYETVSINPDGTADLLLYPHTGRTHQLRVHCAHPLGLGSPILGDTLYGGYHVDVAQKGTSRSTCSGQADRLHLHALSITFYNPLTDSQQTFTSTQLCY